MADVFDFYVYDDRSIRFAIAEPIMLEDKDVTQFRFRIPKVLNNIDMTDWEWWFIFVNAKKIKYTTQLTLTDDEDDPDNFSVATYTVGYGFSGYVGSVSFSIEALNVSGEDIVNEWHTRTYNTHVIDTLQGTRAVIPEPEADAGTGLTAEEKSLILELFSKSAYAEDDASTAYDRLEALWTIITRLVSLNLSHVTSSNQSASVENGSRYVTNLTADTNYSINEVTVTMGGVDITSTSYSSGTVSIPSVTGNIVITATAVTAVSSISAVYTQGGTVYDTYVLDSLKSGLVVTATYSDNTTETIPSTDYTLSGTLEEGTSTITVSYAGKTTTFNVTVSVRIPSTYKQIEYLESDGTQGIMTNVIPRDTMTEVTFEYVGFADGRDNFITGVFNSNNQRYYACWLDSTGKFVFQNRNNSGVWMGPVKPTGKHTVVYNNASHQALYDGVVRGTDALLAITSGDNKIAIFCRGRDTTDAYLDTSSISRIYSLKFTDNSTSNAVAEFIPCYRKLDGVGGMYDTVSQTFYTDSIDGNAFSFGSGAWETGA